MSQRSALIALSLVVMMVLTAATGPAPAAELQDAMDRADILAFFLRIGLEPGQARWMINPLERIQTLVSQHQQNEAARLEALQPTLRVARQSLREGLLVDPSVAMEIEMYRSGRAMSEIALQRSVDAEMRVISQILYPHQNALLNWTPPETIRPPEGIDQRLEMHRISMGRVHEVAQLLDRIRHLDAFNFVTGRMPMINGYLARYFAPNTADFSEAARIVLFYTDEVRMLPAPQWQAAALDIAADMLYDLGLMPAIEPVQVPGTINWQILYRLVTAPQTVQVVRHLAQQ